MQPLVSILIPCYNAGPWIAGCIRSALEQTYPHKEILVLDDGSQDDSLAIIRSFGDRIHFETGPNRGGNVARNRLLQLSTGSWLSFLDADDFLLAQKIEKQLAFAANRPDLDVVYSPPLEFIERTGQMLSFAVEDDDLYANYIRWIPFSTISLLWRKAALEEVGGWKEDQPVCQEHELIFRLIMAGKKFGLFPEAMAVCRNANGGSVSRRAPLKTIMQKMALTDKLEAYLLAKGELNEVRRQALAQARFEAARTAYRSDRHYARTMMDKARTVPLSSFKRINPCYRAALRFFGFECAERLAKIRRLVFPRAVP